MLTLTPTLTLPLTLPLAICLVSAQVMVKRVPGLLLLRVDGKKQVPLTPTPTPTPTLNPNP